MRSAIGLATVLTAAAMVSLFPRRKAVEAFELLGGGKKDGGWDGSGMTTSRLAILPGVTHYAMGASRRCRRR